MDNSCFLYIIYKSYNCKNNDNNIIEIVFEVWKNIYILLKYRRRRTLVCVHIQNGEIYLYDINSKSIKCFYLVYQFNEEMIIFQYLSNLKLSFWVLSRRRTELNKTIYDVRVYCTANQYTHKKKKYIFLPIISIRYVFLYYT